MLPPVFSKNALEIDPAAECRKIEAALRDQVFHRLKRKGVVIGLSGGIDSSVATALCARSLGRERVLALLMPESDSSEDSLRLGRLIAGELQVEALVEEITPLLRAAGCYRRRDEAVRSVFPEASPGQRFKIVLASVSEGTGYNYFHLVIETLDGTQKRARLGLREYLDIVAATNMKQRARKFFEYYHADRLNHAVVGTPNRLEYDQGFFVKNGDGAADVKPIAHLYKSQVYQVAAHLGIPDEIRLRPPTTDTYSLPQSQEEFYFALPYEQMDLCLYARDHGVEPDQAAKVLGLTPAQVANVYIDIDRKRAAARYLHSAPLLVEDIDHTLV